jgi:hypothetical protein
VEGDIAAAHPRRPVGQHRNLPSQIEVMSISVDIPHLREFGWVRIDGAVPASLCARLVDVLESEIGVPVRDPSRWHEHGSEPLDLIPIWGHQAQWDIRQHPNLHGIWATLWGTDRLGVSLDSCRFTPPWQPGFAEPYGIHWDHDPWNAEKRAFQGVLALSDTAVNQGGFAASPPSIMTPLHGRERRPLIGTVMKTGLRIPKGAR